MKETTKHIGPDCRQKTQRVHATVLFEWRVVGCGQDERDTCQYNLHPLPLREQEIVTICLHCLLVLHYCNITFELEDEVWSWLYLSQAFRVSKRTCMLQVAC